MKTSSAEAASSTLSGRIQKVDWPTFAISGGFIALFVIASLINIDTVSSWVGKATSFSMTWFGALWQVIMLFTFLIALVIALSRYGNVKLGKLDKPEIRTFSWVAMIMCTLLAGGGVFWSAAEPMYHFTSVPPYFTGVEAGTAAAVTPALTVSYLHWGFSAWAILGTLSAIVLMYAVYHRGQPLKPRTLLYPVLGDRVMHGPLGVAVDAASIIAVAAGTIGPIGFLGLQMSYMLHDIWPGVPDAFGTQLFIVVVLVGIYTVSAITGLTRGIKWLSNVTVWIAIAMMGLILVVGPGKFIINSFLSGMGGYLQDYLGISLYRGDTEWLGWWTVFYWAWFMGYGPLMAMFVARISRGRSIRQIVLAVGVLAPIVTNFWFTILGGTGIFYELQTPGSVSTVLNEGGLPAALLGILHQLPLQFIFIPAFMALIVGFLATTGDSMSYTIAMAVTGDETPFAPIRVFWGVAMGTVAAILIKIGGVSALQSFIIVTAVPVGFIVLPHLWAAPKVAGILYREMQAEGAEARAELAPAVEL